MRKVEGNDYVNEIIKDKEKLVKAYDFYLEILQKYEKEQYL